MDYLVHECSLTRHKADTLQTALEIIFNKVSWVPAMKIALSNILTEIQTVKDDNSANEKAIGRLSEHADQQEKVLAEMKKTQDEILLLIQGISSKIPSFTDADKFTVSLIAQNWFTQVDTISSINSNVHTLLVHTLPIGNNEGERFAQEMADELIGEAKTLIHRSQQQQPPQAQQSIPKETDEEEEEDEDEEEEANEDIYINLIEGMMIMIMMMMMITFLSSS